MGRLDYKNSIFWNNVFLGLCIVLAIICLCGAVSSFTLRYQQTEAVKHGYAYWHVYDNGLTEFRWKENKSNE